MRISEAVGFLTWEALRLTFNELPPQTKSRCQYRDDFARYGGAIGRMLILRKPSGDAAITVSRHDEVAFAIPLGAIENSRNGDELLRAVAPSLAPWCCALAQAIESDRSLIFVDLPLPEIDTGARACDSDIGMSLRLRQVPGDNNFAIDALYAVG